MKQNMNAVFLDLATFSETVSFSSLAQATSTLTTYALTPPELIIERAYHADIIITNKVELTRHTIEQLPQLKMICVAATGTNNVDLIAAKAHNVIVTNAKDYAGTSVAQYIFAQLLAHFQNVQNHNDNVKKGRWPDSHTFCLHDKPINELAGKSIGLLGFGHIAQAVKQIAIAFGMQVLVSERPNASKIRSGRIAFTDMLRQADIVSLHCPLTHETAHIIDSSALALMKPGAVLINTARGGLINNSDLKQALNNDVIGWAILDVLDVEPPPKDHLLLQADIKNLVITAHIAWASVQAQQRLIEILAKNIMSIKNNKIINRVA